MADRLAPLAERDPEEVIESFRRRKARPRDEEPTVEELMECEENWMRVALRQPREVLERAVELGKEIEARVEARRVGAEAPPEPAREPPTE